MNPETLRPLKFLFALPVLASLGGCVSNDLGSQLANAALGAATSGVTYIGQHPQVIPCWAELAATSLDPAFSGSTKGTNGKTIAVSQKLCASDATGSN